MNKMNDIDAVYKISRLFFIEVQHETPNVLCSQFDSYLSINLCSDKDSLHIFLVCIPNTSLTSFARGQTCIKHVQSAKYVLIFSHVFLPILRRLHEVLSFSKTF